MIQIADIKRTTYNANGVPFEMVTVEKRAKQEGEYDFIMGDDTSDYNQEKPAYPIIFKTDFEIGKYPVTQELWEAVMGENTNPSRFKDKTHPVEQVSWDDIVIGNKKEGRFAFLNKLNEFSAIEIQNLKDGKQFHLPTEAQWEYAASGGKFWEELKYKYAGSNQIKEVAWYWKNSHRETKPVGLKMPNILGLYDMSGNVREWCADNWHETYKGATKNGQVWLSKKNKTIRIIRGGSWNLNFINCRIAYRNRYDSYYRNYGTGFRLSRY